MLGQRPEIKMVGVVGDVVVMDCCGCGNHTVVHQDQNKACRPFKLIQILFKDFTLNWQKECHSALKTEYG